MLYLIKKFTIKLKFVLKKYLKLPLIRLNLTTLPTFPHTCEPYIKKINIETNTFRAMLKTNLSCDQCNEQ